MGDGTLRPAIIMALILIILPLASAKPEGGVNVDPALEDTIFSNINHTEVTHDLDIWNISLTLNQEAFANNTTFTLTAQICTNDGVCLPPESRPLNTSDNRSFLANMTTIEDHTYVNWRVKANYTDDNNSKELFPPSGFYKTWSDCWFYEDAWGGDGCEPILVTIEKGDSLPAISALFTLGMISAAAIIRRQ